MHRWWWFWYFTPPFSAGSNGAAASPHHYAFSPKPQHFGRPSVTHILYTGEHALCIFLHFKFRENDVPSGRANEISKAKLPQQRIYADLSLWEDDMIDDELFSFECRDRLLMMMLWYYKIAYSTLKFRAFSFASLMILHIIISWALELPFPRAIARNTCRPHYSLLIIIISLGYFYFFFDILFWHAVVCPPHRHTSITILMIFICSKIIMPDNITNRQIVAQPFVYFVKY